MRKHLCGICAAVFIMVGVLASPGWSSVSMDGRAYDVSIDQTAIMLEFKALPFGPDEQGALKIHIAGDVTEIPYIWFQDAEFGLIDGTILFLIRDDQLILTNQFFIGTPR